MTKLLYNWKKASLKNKYIELINMLKNIKVDSGRLLGYVHAFFKSLKIFIVIEMS